MRKKTDVKDPTKALAAQVALDKAHEYGKAAPFEIGDQVYIRTVAYARAGRVVAVNDHWVGLEDSCYVGTDGRFAPFCKGEVAANAEIEPIEGLSWVAVGSVCDVQYFGGDLPLKAQ